MPWAGGPSVAARVAIEEATGGLLVAFFLVQQEFQAATSLPPGALRKSPKKRGE